LPCLSSPLILGIDIGTSSVRAILFDKAGRAVKNASSVLHHAPRTTPDGGAEFNPDDLVERVVLCVERLWARMGDLFEEIAGVAVCTFWHSLMGVDAKSQPTTPLTIWADTRSGREVKYLREHLDERAIHARTGCPFHTSYPSARLLWLRRTYPDIFKRTNYWMSIGEYLFLRLFGRTLCSYSMASGTGLFDQQRLDWDEEILNVLQIRSEQLSPLVDADVALSGLKDEWRMRLAPLSEIPWFPALGDGACSNIGSGCVSSNRVALMVGTSGAMRIFREVGAPQTPWGLWCYRADARRYLLGGALSNGGNLYAWMRDILRLGPPEEIERRLAEMEPDTHGLTVLPFLAGERCPGWSPGARATFVGLQLSTRPLDILRAGLESVAYRFALIYELLHLAVPGEKEILATGTALLNSPLWAQIIADVLGQPITMVLEPEASCRGAALMALETLGILKHLRDAPVSLGKTYFPNPEHHRRYREALERHRTLDRKMREHLWQIE